MILKKIIASVLCAAAFMASAASAKELSDWAVPGYDAANSAGLIPYSIAANRISDDITRGEFCEIVMNMYNMMTGKPVELKDCPFTDTQNYAVLEAYSLGVINGKSETEFMPYDKITRQEMAKIIMRTIKSADKDVHITADELEKICEFEDFADTADWATSDMAKSVKYQIINGVSRTQLAPRHYASREQAISMVSRAVSAFADAEEFHQAPEINNLYDGLSVTDKLTVSWDPVPEAQEYAVFVKDANYYSVQMVKTTQKSITLDTEKMPYNNYYSITVAAKLSDYVTTYSAPVEIYFGTEQDVIEVLPLLSDRYNRVFPGGVPFATEAEAASNMTTVTVPVWKLNGAGGKFAAKMSIEVNRNLADEVVKIFTEIYKDKEQFPIKDMGGYSWRTTASGNNQSQHSYGTCIDINPNENYYCYAATGQAIVGSFWKPYENPYSIPSDGSVVRAFAKYGWSWGGNAWSSLRDYMHFTYLGK